MTKTLTTLVFLFVLSTSGASTAVAQHETPTDSLLHLVGEDAGLCLEIRDLAGHSKRFADSTFFHRLQRSQTVRRLLQSKDGRGLRRLKSRLEQLSGQPLKSLTGELFGKETVLAVYPNDKDEPAGVLLTKASAAGSLDKALRVWNQAEPESVTEARSYQGVEYFRRSRGKKSSRSLFYARLTDVFVLSDREEMVRKVIRFAKARNGAGNEEGGSSPGIKSLPQTGRYRNARKSLRGRPVCTLFLNPRAWGDTLPSKNGAETDENRFALSLWKSCDWVMAGVRLENGVVIDATMRYDDKSLPNRWRRFVAANTGDAEFLTRIPADALIAVSGRFDPGLVHALFKQWKSEKKEEFEQLRILFLGFDVVDRLLPRLKRSVAAYVTGRDVQKAGAVPFHALIAFGLQSKTADTRSKPKSDWREPFDRGLVNLLGFLTNLYNVSAAKTAGGKKATRFAALKSTTNAEARLHWIDRIRGFQPTIAHSPSHLIAASTPQLVRDFLGGQPNGRLSATAGFRRWQDRFLAGGNQVVYVRTRRLGDHLQKNRKSVLSLLAKPKRKSTEQATRELEAAVDVLRIADAVFLAAQITNSSLRVTLGAAAAPEKRNASPSAK